MSIHEQDVQVQKVAKWSVADSRDYFSLLKPRVMSLVVFTALVGLVVAPGHMNPVLACIAIICIGVGGGASGALNMWYDADIDAVMKRTSKRPIPAGKITRAQVFYFGMFLSCASVIVMGLFINWFSALFLAFTIFFYVVIYTIWLKRSTPQNIVIGGASGAFPPMIGWAAVTGTISIESVVLFFIIFLWTPPHFWALSLFTTIDYNEARVPMMPTVRGEHYTKKQILIYAILMALAGVAPVFMRFSGLFYAATSIVLGVVFVYYSYRLWRADRGTQTILMAKKVFFFSLVYLAALFAVLLVETVLWRLYAWWII